MIVVPQKKMVPSDLIPARLTAGMHGTELREQRAPGVSPFGSPASGFSADRIRASGHAAACFSLSLARDRLLETAFRSPATATAFTDSIPGSTFPACFFAPCAAVP